MVRLILGVIVGYAVWSVIWIGVNALFFKEASAIVASGQPYMEPGPYVAVLALSVACSLAAGLATAAVARSRAGAAVWIMAGLLLLTGVAVQAGVWNLQPVWFHLIFLALLVPVSVAGERLVTRRAV